MQVVTDSAPSFFDRLPEVLTRTLREGLLWVLGAVALLLVLSLLTFDPADPGFAYTGEPGQVTNLIGPLGAWVADVLLLLFGGPAYLWPLVVFGLGWWLFRGQPEVDGGGRASLLLRSAGFIATLVSSCALATLHFAPGMLRNTAGGILGGVVGTATENAMGLLGGTLALLALWFTAVSIGTGVSWLTVMDLIGKAVLDGSDWVRQRLAARREAEIGREAREERQEAVQKEQKKVAARPPPKIEKPAVVVVRSERIEKERQVSLFERPANTALPALNLLDDPPKREEGYSQEALEAMSRLVEIKLRDFGIEVEVVAVHPGPVVTRFELKPSPGVKVSQITSLSKDLARSLSAISVRVVDVIPGKAVIGLEIPNEKREVVTLGEIIKSKAYDDMASPLVLALGKDIAGLPVVTDLARMPHLLVAGTTGSGKSVAINAMILSLLYKATAEQVRLIMIDPKMLELSVYEGIPHLLAPVVTDMKQAANALRWCVAEMERRYFLMANLGVRNIGGFNRKITDAQQAGKPIKDPIAAQKVAQGLILEDGTQNVPDLTTLPYIVVVIDELADLMMIVGKKVEELIARLAQKARASGIHLILATQRPSVDVITGLIKANIPSRVAFQVSAKVDSRTILDQGGAESLLGNGDMLYLPAGTSVPTRVHGAFVQDHEVHRVVEALRSSAPEYIDAILDGPQGGLPGMPYEGGEGTGGEVDPEQDALYDEAVKIVLETRKASVSGVQRRLKIGYNRAARLVESMESAGLVGALQPNGSREVLVPAREE
jgi:S-DNA-T family DNA segregation ATPase FtsK/SpoIIIE